MKTRILLFILLVSNVSLAQGPINNKGNRLQTYPKITGINPAVQTLTNQVSIPNLESSIRWMQSLGNHNADSPKALEAQNWLVDQFESFGLNVYTHHFFGWGVNKLPAGNVIAIQYGTEFPDEYIVISSHYDHPGPGADDNASGTAGVLEIARILSQHQFKRSIMYISFNAEEYWMLGSYPFVEKCATEDMNILGCLNLDMLGFFPKGAGPLTMFTGSSYISDRLFEYYQTVANIYVTDIPTKRFSKGNSWGGDHEPFNVYEYPALYIGDIEYIDSNHCYHQPCDTLGNGVNSLELAQGFVKATLAATVELANAWLAPQNLSAIPLNNKVVINWDAAPETAKYRVYKNNTLLTETTETSFSDVNVANNAKYTYYVIGVHVNDGKESAKSNCDSLIMSPHIALPYSNNFEENLSDFYPNNPDWKLTTRKVHAGNTSLSNIDTPNGEVPVNYFSTIELRPFSIADTVSNISLNFWMQTKILTEYYNKNQANAYVEVTTDRKKWNKMVKIPQECSKWSKLEISLNEFIGEPFVQIRFRIESIGVNDKSKTTQLFIDDLNIDFTPAIRFPIPENVRISSKQSHIEIKWDSIDRYILGYKVYRNGQKLDSLNPNRTQCYDYDMTFDNPCYEVTAIYPEKESDFSKKVCLNGESIETIVLSKLEITPNPSFGILNIKTGLLHPYQIDVYDSRGIKVFHQASFMDGKLNLLHFPKGIYILRIATAKEGISKKIVIQ